MKKTKSKKRLPKPVTAWWFVDSDGAIAECLYRTRAYAEWALYNGQRYHDGERVIRLRLTPIAPKPRRRK